MKILCIGYRDWANNIYKSIEDIANCKIISSEEDYNEQLLEDFNPDIILWYGWSKIINIDIINKYFCVMLHPSPLPKYRGGSPIQNQIINGETKSAVTLFHMNQEIDKGDIIYQESFSLLGDLDDIFKRIETIGILLTKKMLNNWNNLNFIKQDESKSTYYKRRKPIESEITIEDIKNNTALDIHNKIRALQDPYPNAFIVCSDGSKLYLTKSKIQ
jgi:methionyl-tRNA formyltransferase